MAGNCRVCWVDSTYLKMKTIACATTVKVSLWPMLADQPLPQNLPRTRVPAQKTILEPPCNSTLNYPK